MSIPNPSGDSPILYGFKSVPKVARTLQVYLVRPDEVGESPTIMLIPSAWGLTSTVKELSRQFGRYGLAVVVPDLYRGEPPNRDAGREEAEEAASALSPQHVVSDLLAVAWFVANPTAFWSNAGDGFGLLGIGSGGRWAALAARQGQVAVSALALCYSPLRAPEQDGEAAPGEQHHPLSVLPHVDVPILGIYGREDEVVPSEEVHSAREMAPRAEWLLYEGAGHDFLDDHLESYRHGAATDAIERLAAFYGTHLPPRR